MSFFTSPKPRYIIIIDTSICHTYNNYVNREGMDVKIKIKKYCECRTYKDLARVISSVMAFITLAMKQTDIYIDTCITL
jgi:hypothetical protein